MADPTTDPTAPGNTTSSWTLVKIMTVFGGALVGLGTFLGYIQPSFPHATWIPGAIALSGGIVAALTALGYIRGRSDVHVEMIRQGLHRVTPIPRDGAYAQGRNPPVGMRSP